MRVLTCPSCRATRDAFSSAFDCECGDLFGLEQAVISPGLRAKFDARGLGGGSGVWRYRELIYPSLPADAQIDLQEGNTPLYESTAVARFCGLDQLALKHEGMNPTGSFKDRGMTVAVSHAARGPARTVVCASTGNTAASMAAYAARAGMRAAILVPEGFTALAKLSQALAYGARALVVKGSFDEAMRIARELGKTGEVALVNSINPFRVSGQKSILLELLQQLQWDPPDWFVFPAGNLGNCSAFGAALADARAAELIPRGVRLAAVQAGGAAPFHAAYLREFDELQPVEADTIATAIRIGEPVSYRRARTAIRDNDGVVEVVTDTEILNAKATVDAAGIGAEPASCASVAGVKRLVQNGVIQPGERVVALLTGHLMKDSETTLAFHRGELGGEAASWNQPVSVAAELDAVRSELVFD